MAVSKGLAIERKFLNELAQQKFDKAKKKTLGSLDNANRTYLSQLLEQEDLINAQRNFFLNSFDTSLNELRRQVYTAQRASRDRQAITGIYDDFAQVRDNNILNEEIDYQISNLLQTSMGNALNVASQQQANLRSQVQATYQGLIENERDEAIENGTATIDHGKQFMKFLSGSLNGALLGLGIGGVGKFGLNLALTGISWGLNKAVLNSQNKIAAANSKSVGNYFKTAGIDSKINFIAAPGGKQTVGAKDLAQRYLKWENQNIQNKINQYNKHLGKIDAVRNNKVFNYARYNDAKIWYANKANPLIQAEVSKLSGLTGSLEKQAANDIANKITRKLKADPSVRKAYAANYKQLNKTRLPGALRNTPLKAGLFSGWGFYAAIAGAIIGGIVNTTRTTSYRISQASLDALKQSSAWKSLADIGGFSVDDMASSLGDSVKNYQKTNWKWPWE